MQVAVCCLLPADILLSRSQCLDHAALCLPHTVASAEPLPPTSSAASWGCLLLTGAVMMMLSTVHGNGVASTPPCYHAKLLPIVGWLHLPYLTAMAV